MIRRERIPKAFRETLTRLARSHAEFGVKTVRLGSITYLHEQLEQSKHPRRKAAVSFIYYPKDALPLGAAKGLGYFLEALATRDLKKRREVKYIRSSSAPSAAQKTQLERAGLPFGKHVRINRWIKKIWRGYFTRARKQRKAR